jgi:hypothetical protein
MQTAESAGYFCELDQILTEDEAYPGYAHFLEWPALQFNLVCDVKGLHPRAKLIYFVFNRSDSKKIS